MVSEALSIFDDDLAHAYGSLGLQCLIDEQSSLRPHCHLLNEFPESTCSLDHCLIALLACIYLDTL